VRTRTSLVMVALVALSPFVVSQIGAAQDPPAPSTVRAPTIALLDVGYVFRNHQRFKGIKEDLKADAERKQAEFKTEADAVTQLGERLRELRHGTPDYKSLEAEVAKRQAELTAKVQLWKRDMARTEAKVTNNLYQEICDAANYYAQQHGIDVVLRFDGEPPDPEQLDSVWAHVGRSVVAYRSDMDITPAVLQEINRTGPVRAAPARQQQVPFRQQ
jgi:Skp family chaperone for outer membrane proteins